MSRLILFPGLGADERMFAPQRSLPLRVEVPPRIAPEGGETLADYARRVASSLDVTGEPFHLGGASFGGMLALEVARHVSPRSVVLISACRSRNAIPLLARVAGAALSPIFPARSFALMKRSAALARRTFGMSSEEHVKLFSDMLRDAPEAHLKWCVRALLGWSGVDKLDVPIFHVHGELDRVLPLRRVHPDVVIPGAGHLANLTHPREVNKAIATFLSSVEPLSAKNRIAPHCDEDGATSF